MRASVVFFGLNGNGANGTRMKFRLTDDDAGSTRIQAFLAIRLVLFALLLPILISTISELWNLTTGMLTHAATMPILAFLTILIFWVLMVFIGGSALILLFLPFCAEIISIAWSIICRTVGLLLEVTIIVPRMFLGSALDLLLCSKRERYPSTLFSPAVTLLLAAVLPAVAMASSYAWFPWYQSRVAAGHNIAEGEELLRSHNRNVAAERKQRREDEMRHFIAEFKQVPTASSISEARTQLQEAERAADKIPSYEDQQDARARIKRAFEILDKYKFNQEAKTGDEPRWRRELRQLTHRLSTRYSYLYE